MAIHVTKTYLPEKEKLLEKINTIYETNWVTNFGKLYKQLEKELKEFLGVKYIVLTANGTLALQIAYKLLNLKGKVITTPFTFVATVSSIFWESLIPLFVDIDKDTFCLDPTNIEKILAKQKNISAIVPVHVFGNACNIEAIDFYARRYDLKVIYDASHCFGVNYKGKSILSYGDISIISFHATKLFHTIEGGAIVTNNREIYERAKKIINFGIEDYYRITELGINAKMNEFEAAMGLCVLDDIEKIMERRKKAWKYYYSKLKNVVKLQKRNENCNNNYAYFPIVLDTEKQVVEVLNKLKKYNIYPRRYFYPSLDKLPYINRKNTPISLENSHYISERILCLPLFDNISKNIQDIIINTVKEVKHA